MRLGGSIHKEVQNQGSTRGTETNVALVVPQSRADKSREEQSGAGRNGGGVGRADDPVSMLSARTGNGNPILEKIAPYKCRGSKQSVSHHACTLLLLLLLLLWTCICCGKRDCIRGWLAEQADEWLWAGSRSVRGHPVRAYGAPKSGSWGRGRQQTLGGQGYQVLCMSGLSNHLQGPGTQSNGQHDA
ncbi:hypothetical protein LA080_003012 [Diaporthe eres]|nr:hypothetical protein LA080_003012 [Diaporthe eres]